MGRGVIKQGVDERGTGGLMEREGGIASQGAAKGQIAANEKFVSTLLARRRFPNIRYILMKLLGWGVLTDN